MVSTHTTFDHTGRSVSTIENINTFSSSLEPATSWVVDTYLCTSAACLTFDVSSTSSIMSWTLKIFITTFGLFGAYLVRRWHWFESELIEHVDEFDRTDLIEHRPWSQIVLSQILNAVGLAFIYHATSNSFVSLVFCLCVFFKTFLLHQCFTTYMWIHAMCCSGPNFIRRISDAEYQQNGIDQTAYELNALQQFLHTSEGRRKMSTVKAENYGGLSRFRDGGNHFDLEDLEDEEDEGLGWLGWLGKMCMRLMLGGLICVVVVGVISQTSE